MMICGSSSWKSCGRRLSSWKTNAAWDRGSAPNTSPRKPMAKVLIDGQEIELGDNERLNGIQAARRAGVEIPHYCWHPGLSVVASCRMCLVETGAKNPQTGEVSMAPKLVPACQTPAKDGTV